MPDDTAGPQQHRRMTEATEATDKGTEGKSFRVGSASGTSDTSVPYVPSVTKAEIEDDLPPYIRQDLGDSTGRQLHRLHQVFHQTAQHPSWPRGLFRLMRELRGLVRTAGRDAHAEAVHFDGLIARWHKAAGIDCPLDDLIAEAVEKWNAVRHPVGQDALAEVAKRLDTEARPADATRFRDERYRRLVHACLLLQTKAWPDPFFLTCRDAAALAGFEHHQYASRAFKLLESHHLIKRVESGTTTRATRFQYTGRSFNRETGEIDDGDEEHLPF